LRTHCRNFSHITDVSFRTYTILTAAHYSFTRIIFMSRICLSRFIICLAFSSLAFSFVPHFHVSHFHDLHFRRSRIFMYRIFSHDTIYDSVYLTCSKKLTGSQLSLPDGSLVYHTVAPCFVVDNRRNFHVRFPDFVNKTQTSASARRISTNARYS